MTPDALRPSVGRDDPRPVLYTDLDDTLFQTARKMSGGICDSRLAAEATNGHHSYMSDTQARMTAWLLQVTRMIPVTARSTAALARCRIAFDGWRIAANGAVILDAAGDAEPDWAARIARISQENRDALQALDRTLTDRNRNGRFRHWIVMEAGRPIYFCAKSNGAEDWLDEAQDLLRPLAGDGFTEHRNGNNLSFTPAGVSKRAAVQYLDTVIGGAALRLGMGDSLTDLPFMRACDLMIVPPGSQIARAFEGG